MQVDARGHLVLCRVLGTFLSRDDQDLEATSENWRDFVQGAGYAVVLFPHIPDIRDEVKPNHMSARVYFSHRASYDTELAVRTPMVITGALQLFRRGHSMFVYSDTGDEDTRWMTMMEIIEPKNESRS